MPTIIFLIILLCFAIYIIKNYKTIDFQLKIILSIIFLFIIINLYFDVNGVKKVTSLKKDFSLTTGQIEEYFVANRSKSTNKVKYIYLIGNRFFENSYNENPYVSIPDYKPDLKTLYLVIYEKKKPKNSFLLLNYPVNTSEDFKKYKKMFENKIPENAIKEN